MAYATISVMKLRNVSDQAAGFCTWQVLAGFGGLQGLAAYQAVDTVGLIIPLQEACHVHAQL